MLKESDSSDKKHRTNYEDEDKFIKDDKTSSEEEDDDGGTSIYTSKSKKRRTKNAKSPGSDVISQFDQSFPINQWP